MSVPVVKRNRNIRVDLTELKFVEVQRNGQVVRLISSSPSEGRVHSEYLFQHGNADNLVRFLCHLYLLSDVSTDRKMKVYEVTSETQEKLRKTFAELEIEDIKDKGKWISIVSRSSRRFT